MKATKEKMISVLKTNVPLWNRYVRFCKHVIPDWFADLSYADLRCANLSYADLRCANLHSANLDFSILSLSCSSLQMQTDEKIRKQIAYHFASLIKHGLDVTDEEKAIFESIKEYANGFHRTGVEKL